MIARRVVWVEKSRGEGAVIERFAEETSLEWSMEHGKAADEVEQRRGWT